MSSLKHENKAYWRSLDRLLDSPAVPFDAAGVEGDGRISDSNPEFPEGAEHAPDSISRRSMLGVMGASFALAGTQACRRPVETIVPYVEAPEHIIPGQPVYYATSFAHGVDATGVLIESHEGRPTKLEGNELHSMSDGAASHWMQASVLDLYDPDRSRSVRRRAEGEDMFRPADWELFSGFLGERLAELGDRQGEGLAVLSRSYSSPTMARLVAKLRAAYPEVRWVVYEPSGDENVFAGVSAALGGALRPVYDFGSATRVLSLDADSLLSESGALRNARGYAHSRRADGDDIGRLYVVESSLSTTGSSADHRVVLESRRVASFAAAVARELGVAGAPSGSNLEQPLSDQAKLIADDLRAAGANSLVVAGRSQSAEVHVLATSINQALGAIGTTVSYVSQVDADAGRVEDLADLTRSMQAGEIDTLCILGGNPVYDAPADLEFSSSLEKVAHSFHLSPALDETSAVVDWHLPQTHYLEEWGDTRAADGTLSPIQPLIAPLHGGRSVIEVLEQLVSGEVTSGYDLVRETWRTLLPSDDFDNSWHQVLHDGVLTESTLPAAEVTVDSGVLEASITTIDQAASTATSGLEVTFRPSFSTFDGRYANNGWLQELPDALTKITWNNAVLIGPSTARELGVSSGDSVAVSVGDRQVEGPVFVMPGQAAGSIGLTLGYGRSAAGRVGDGIGFSAYGIRSSDALGFTGGAAVTKTSTATGDELAQTQEHWSMEGRDLVREATVDEYRANPGVVGAKPDPKKSHQLFPEFDYSKSPQWGMTIDLNSCIGCNACVVACQSENNIPIVGAEQVAKGREMHWLRVDRYFSGEPDEPEVVYQPIPCMHCENAPCEQVCPVAATVHDEEGLNSMVYNRCIGTRYCSNNCPYKVRRFNFFNYTKDTPELVAMVMNPDVTVRSRGVMEKCTYCVQRISVARIEARHEDRPIRDGEVKTACQQTCPADAIAFGDIVDAETVVSQRKADQRDYVVLGELNNRPRTSYGGKLRNPHPDWESA